MFASGSGLTAAAYGTWSSGLDSKRVVGASVQLDDVQLDQATWGGDGTVYFSEVRPLENGRTVVCSRDGTGRLTTWTVPEHSVRSRVHEYGGAAFFVHDRRVFYTNFDDQCLYAQDAPMGPPVLVGDRGFYADGVLDSSRGNIVAVREDHTGKALGDKRGPTSSIVCVDTKEQRTKALVSGSDFYACPRLSPDGRHLAWLEWAHPHMPWDVTELWVAELTPSGDEVVAASARLVAGGNEESVSHPFYANDGTLYFMSDRTGYWNLYCEDNDGETEEMEVRAVLPLNGDCAQPLWELGHMPYAVSPDSNDVLISYTDKKRTRLVLVSRQPFAKPAVVDTGGYNWFGSMAIASTGKAYLIAAGPAAPHAVVEIALQAAKPPSETAPIAEAQKTGGWFATVESYIGKGLDRVNAATGGKLDAATTALFTGLAERIGWQAVLVVRPSVLGPVDAASISSPEPMEFPASGGSCHGFFYAPTNAQFVGPSDELPPLLVRVHGPGRAAVGCLDLELQYFASHGFAVLDISPRGSCNYGRAYRQQLCGKWGQLDVDDVCQAATSLAQAGRVDGSRMVVFGVGSGGYTALAALTMRSVFCTGACMPGMSDLMAVAADTHKFHSHMLDTLVGPLPDASKRYRERSPITHVAKLKRPVLLIHGHEDQVVPRSQSEIMFDAVRRRGVPVAYVLADGEQHTLRKASNRMMVLDACYYFFSRVLHFKLPADFPINATDAVEIHNVGRLQPDTSDTPRVSGHP